jgi:outer membrane protein insertion porin family
MSTSFRRRARWIVYPLLAVLAILILAMVIAIRSGRVDRWARERLIQELSMILGRPIQADRVTLHYLPPGATIEGLRSAAPVVAAERVDVDISLRALLRGHILVKDIEMTRPELAWDVDGPPLYAPQPAAAGAPRWSLRRLRVREGSLRVGSERRLLDADLEGVSALVTNVDELPGKGGPWAAGIRFDSGRFRYGDLQLAGTKGSVTLEARGDGDVRVESLHIQAEGVDVKGRGELLAGEPRRGRFLLSGIVDPSSPAVTRPLPQFGARRVEATLEVIFPGEGVNVTGRFSAEEPVFDDDRTASADGPHPPWRGARATGQLDAGQGRLRITGDIEQLAGGHVTGTYEGSADLPRRHTLTVTGTALDLAEVLTHVPLPGDPAVVPSSSVSVEAAMTWAGEGLREASGKAKLTFAGRPGEAPLDGTAMAAWSQGRLTIGSSSLRLPGVDFEVSGPMELLADPARLDLDIEMAAHDATPLAHLLERRFSEIFREPDGTRRLPIIPTDLEGSFDASIALTGDTAHPRVVARTTSGGARLSLPAGLTPRPGPIAARVPLALDTLSAEITWTRERLGLAIDRATGDGLDLSGTVEIATTAAGARPEKIALSAREVPAELMVALSGMELEGVSGAVSATADLQASAPSARAPAAAGLAILTGPVTLSAPRLEVKGYVLEDVEAAGALDQGVVRLDRATLRSLGGTASGSGAWPGSLSFELADLDLASLQEKIGGPLMTGTFSGKGRLSGGGADPAQVEGNVSATQVIVGGLEVGDVQGTLAGSPGRVRFDLRDGVDALHGTGDLIFHEGSAPAIEAQVTAHPFILERLRAILPPTALAGLRGNADADLRITGTLGSLRDLVVHARVERLELAAGEYTLHNQEPLVLTMMDGFLTLANGRIVGDRTDIELGGSMNLAGGHEATARIAGTFDLGLLELISPESRAVGPGRLEIRIVEGAEGTSYTGEVAVENASLRHPALPQPVEHLTGVANFEPGGVLRLARMTFDTGGGHVLGDGWLRFEGASIPEMHLELHGSGIRAELFPSLRAFFDADMTIDRQGEEYRVAGHVSILRAIYSRAFGMEASSILARNREFGPVPIRRTDAPPVFLDVHIEAEKDLWIRNDDALIEAAANLTLGGTLAEPELYGRITALEGGFYRFRDVTYRIEGGSLEFTDVTRIDPELEISASTRVQQYDVRLKITGHLSKPIYELSSEPPLPQSDIVWLLVTGRTLSDSGSDATRAAAESQVAGYLAGPVAGAVTAPLGRLLGVSSLQIDPTLLNGTADPTARLTVSKRVAQDLLFTYSAALGESGEEVYQIEYNPGRFWDLIGTRDLDGSVGADVRIRRRWRGWGWGNERITAPGAEAPAEPAGRMRVGSIRVVTDVLTDKEKSLRRRLKFEAGDPLVRGDLLEGREKLRLHYVEHGYPAAQVDVVESEPKPGPPVLVDVTYTIVAGPRYELEIEGDVRQRRIRKAVEAAWQEPVLLEELVDEARNAAVNVLKGKGRYLASVESRLDAPAEDERVVTLHAEPGPKVRVRDIRIVGNQEMPEDRIRRQMLTKPGGLLKLFGQGLLKEDVLKDDLDAIRALYQANGFLDATVTPPKVEVVGDGDQADIEVRIQEGERYRIGSVALEGEVPEIQGADMLASLNLAVGQNLTTAGLEQAADRLRAFLDARGFPQARVTPRTEGQPDRMRVVFAVSPAERLRIGHVTFSGNNRTNDRTVHREITLDGGDYFTRAGMLASQRNLFRLGVFRTVETQTTPTPGRPGYVDVHFKLIEGPPILTAWGVGYDSQDGPRGSFELADNNLFGTRRSAGMFVRGSAVDRRFQLTLRDPNLFGERIETLLSAFLEQEETDSFTADRVGIVTQLSRRLTTHTILYGRYQLEDVDLSDLKVSPEEADEETVRLGSVGVSLANDTRDDIVYPTGGGLSSIDVRTYGPLWGSEEQFLKVFASATYFKDIGKKVVWASSVRAGLISSRDIPLSERFYAGGDTTLRGFEYKTVGPKDPVTGEALGGEGIFLLNQELRFPLYKAFTGVVFYDTGNVYADFRDYDLGDLRHVLGLGLRVSTPVGPFRVEYGRKLDREPGESRGEIFFSIGQAF